MKFLFCHICVPPQLFFFFSEVKCCGLVRLLFCEHLKPALSLKGVIAVSSIHLVPVPTLPYHSFWHKCVYGASFNYYETAQAFYYPTVFTDHIWVYISIHLYVHLLHRSRIPSFETSLLNSYVQPYNSFLPLLFCLTL